MHSYDYCHNPNLWDIVSARWVFKRRRRPNIRPILPQHGTLIEDKSRGAHEMVPRIATCKVSCDRVRLKHGIGNRLML